MLMVFCIRFFYMQSTIEERDIDLAVAEVALGRTPGNLLKRRRAGSSPPDYGLRGAWPAGTALLARVRARRRRGPPGPPITACSGRRGHRDTGERHCGRGRNAVHYGGSAGPENADGRATRAATSTTSRSAV